MPVMTMAASRIAARTGAGNSAPPANCAATACCASSARIWSTMARRREVIGRQAFQVAFEVMFDLALGFDDEAQAQAVTQPTRGQSDQEGAAVPERVEQAGAVAQFGQALLRPREVVDLLACRLRHLRLQFDVVGGQRLRLVQRLRTDLADVVHAHQGAGQPPVFRTQFGRRRRCARRRALGPAAP